MKSFRKIIFWMHLVAALICGVVIFVMCATGALLSFESNIIGFAERDARYVTVPAEAVKLDPQDVIDKLKVVRPDAEPTAMAITNESGATWAFNLGSNGYVYVNPYNGDIAGHGNKAVRGFMSYLRSWHRWIAMDGDNRAIGKTVTGVSNIVFLFLAISGIYIWLPRKFDWRLIKPVVWFRRGLRGKARNFNWHNVIGFWSSLFLIVFTLTATVISFQWAGNLLYTITGNEVPAERPREEKKGETAYTFPENINGAIKVAEAKSADWKSISLRLPIKDDAAVLTIDEGIYWNIFARSTLTVDTKTGAETKWDAYGERNSAQQLRTWFRFLHTGEVGGIIGQTIGFLACVGGAFLVWTGFSLAFRRFGKWWKRRSGEQLEEVEV